MNAAERLRTSKDKEKVIAVGDFIMVTETLLVERYGWKPSFKRLGR